LGWAGVTGPVSTQPAGLFCSVLVVPPPGWAAGASSGPKLELERHLTRLADSGVKRLVVEGSGCVGPHR
jgi:hypothetical protein